MKALLGLETLLVGILAVAALYSLTRLLWTELSSKLLREARESSDGLTAMEETADSETTSSETEDVGEKLEAGVTWSRPPMRLVAVVFEQNDSGEADVDSELLLLEEERLGVVGGLWGSVLLKETCEDELFSSLMPLSSACCCCCWSK